ncbi:hypothetical protein ACEV6Q_26395 [Enterobacter ludwigii]|uniref:hypothetical protein n=1 Tax=Enterobacter ludwigii TaxID=299767 RepID=UPI003BEEFBB7
MADSHSHNQLISLRDVVSTVEHKLLGANLGDAVDWIKKYFFPKSDSFRLRNYRGPRLYVIEYRYNIKRADGNILNGLFSMINSFPYFLSESCFDTHCFSVEEINRFFESLSIGITFRATEMSNYYHKGNAGRDNDNAKDESTPDRAGCIKVLHLKKYRDDDPLALAIEIRNKEWLDFNPDDKNSRVNQDAIIMELTEKGLSKKTAASIELVACPIKRS